MTRNLITAEVAESNRTGLPGGLTFNALPPHDYEGFVLVVACVRLGDHAHLDVETGRQIVDGVGRPIVHRGAAGRLVMAWPDWLAVRDLLELVPWTRIAEVENPTVGQARRHAS